MLSRESDWWSDSRELSWQSSARMAASCSAMAANRVSMRSVMLSICARAWTLPHALYEGEAGTDFHTVRDPHVHPRNCTISVTELLMSGRTWV